MFKDKEELKNKLENILNQIRYEYGIEEYEDILWENGLLDVGNDFEE
jgi:hypothetical protein